MAGFPIPPPGLDPRASQGPLPNMPPIPTPKPPASAFKRSRELSPQEKQSLILGPQGVAPEVPVLSSQQLGFMGAEPEDFWSKAAGVQAAPGLAEQELELQEMIHQAQLMYPNEDPKALAGQVRKLYLTSKKEIEARQFIEREKGSLFGSVKAKRLEDAMERFGPGTPGYTGMERVQEAAFGGMEPDVLPFMAALGGPAAGTRAGAAVMPRAAKVAAGMGMGQAMKPLGDPTATAGALLASSAPEGIAKALPGVGALRSGIVKGAFNPWVLAGSLLANPERVTSRWKAMREREK